MTVSILVLTANVISLTHAIRQRWKIPDLSGGISVDDASVKVLDGKIQLVGRAHVLEAVGCCHNPSVARKLTKQGKQIRQHIGHLNAPWLNLALVEGVPLVADALVLQNILVTAEIVKDIRFDDAHLLVIHNKVIGFDLLRV